MDLLKWIRFSAWYYLNPPWDTGLSPPELLSFIDRHTPGRALDLGCGTGTNCITLSRHGWDVTGIDFAPRAIRMARKKSKETGYPVAFFQADVTKLGFLSGSFDLVLDIGCFHGLDQESRGVYMTNLETLLVSNGSFLLYGMLNTPSAEGSGPGIKLEEMKVLSHHFELVSRQDGLNLGTHPSVWLEYKKR